MREGGDLVFFVNHFVYFKFCIVCVYVLPTLKKLISSWLCLKLTNIAKTLYGGEKPASFSQN